MTIESDFTLIWPWDSRKQSVRITGSQKQNEISRDGVLDTRAKTTLGNSLAPEVTPMRLLALQRTAARSLLPKTSLSFS